MIPENKPPDQSASSGFVVSSTSMLKLLISLIRWATPYQVSCTSPLWRLSWRAGWRDYDRRLSVCLSRLCERRRFRCVLRQLVCFYFISFFNTWQLFTVNGRNVRVLPKRKWKLEESSPSAKTTTKRNSRAQQTDGSVSEAIPVYPGTSQTPTHSIDSIIFQFNNGGNP